METDRKTLRMKRRETYQKVAGINNQTSHGSILQISEYQLDDSEMIKEKKKAEKEQNIILKESKLKIATIEKEWKDSTKIQTKQFDLSLVTISKSFRIRSQNLETQHTDFLSKWKEQNKSLEQADPSEYNNQLLKIRKAQLNNERNLLIEKQSCLHSHQLNFLTVQYHNELEKIKKVHLIEKQCMDSKNIVQQRHCRSIHRLQAQQYREIIFSKKKRLPRESMILLELEEAEKELIKYQKTERANIEQIQKNEEKKLETSYQRILEVLKLKYDKLTIDADFKQKQDTLKTNSMYEILVHRLSSPPDKDPDPVLEEILRQRETALTQLQEECDNVKAKLLDSQIL